MYVRSFRFLVLLGLLTKGLLAKSIWQVYDRSMMNDLKSRSKYHHLRKVYVKTIFVGGRIALATVRLVFLTGFFCLELIATTPRPCRCYQVQAYSSCHIFPSIGFPRKRRPFQKRGTFKFITGIKNHAIRCGDCMSQAFKSCYYPSWHRNPQ